MNMKHNTAVQLPHLSRKSGFTLIEMVVSTSIFIVVMLIIVGALVNLSDASRKARSTRIVLDNLSAAMDSMSRNIRMGTAFHCGCETSASEYATTENCAMTGDAGGGGEMCLAFEGPNGDPNTPNDQVVYRLFEGQIQRSTEAGVSGSFIGLTAPEIAVGRLQFFVYGTEMDQDQPVIMMQLQGSAAVTKRTRSDFNLQTTIAARTPNFAPL
jgi:type II secretory pathway pseudopilin PulG